LMLMLITLGVGIIVRGLVILFWDKETHTIPPIGGEGLLQLGNVTIVPQALWIVFAMVIVLVAVDYFFRRTLMGKAIKAVSINGLAAQLVGINVPQVLRICFGLSAVIGGLAGVLITPVTYMAFDSGLALSIKGFSAAIIGGMGHGMGAVVGGLLLGLTEAMAAGYLSSAYKDVVALAMILLVMLAAPNGIFGVKGAERV
jgi:branched-chain amino acid transport system permease protein